MWTLSTVVVAGSPQHLPPLIVCRRHLPTACLPPNAPAQCHPSLATPDRVQHLTWAAVPECDVAWPAWVRPRMWSRVRHAPYIGSATASDTVLRAGSSALPHAAHTLRVSGTRSPVVLPALDSNGHAAWELWPTMLAGPQRGSFESRATSSRLAHCSAGLHKTSRDVSPPINVPVCPERCFPWLSSTPVPQWL
jgi:hypothetical protein